MCCNREVKVGFIKKVIFGQRLEVSERVSNTDNKRFVFWPEVSASANALGWENS